MGNLKILKPPLMDSDIRSLKAGGEIFITGTIYTARDMAHKRLCQALKEKKPLPFDLNGAIIYFVGPTPAGDGLPIGSAGPTTSSRMDRFSPALIANGLRATIGKGYRSQAVRDALKEYCALHLAAIGGAGALLSKKIISSEVIAYEDLGTEAIRKLEVIDFPVIVAYDCHGNSVYDFRE